MSVRILPQANGFVDRRHLVLYPFFGPQVAGGAAARTRTARAGGITTARSGAIRTARSGGITTIAGRP